MNLKFSFRTLFAWRRYLIIASAQLAITGCQSAAYKSWDKIHLGMDKSHVVETVGSPTKTRRWQGKDRWLYEFADHPEGGMRREVHFEHGRVVYAGPPVRSAVSAAEQDKINDSANSDEERRLGEIEQERETALGASRPSKSGQRSAEDVYDRKIREVYYGLDPDPSIEKKKRVPVFQPVQ